MAKPVIMPRLGQSVESCTIARWLKKKGDHVTKGTVLLSYETDKASFDLEAEDDGIILEIFFNDGDEVPVLGNIAVIGSTGEPTDLYRPQGAQLMGEKELPVQQEQNSKPVLQAPIAEIEFIAGSEGKINISPRAKNLAEKLNVYYLNLKGSGPQGRIIEKDIEEAALSLPRLTPTSSAIINETKMAPVAAGSGAGGRITERDIAAMYSKTDEYEVVKLSNVRKLIARGMLNSLQNSAQLTHHMSADARNILSLREDIKEKMKKGSVTENITINDMVCLAVVKALMKNNYANAHFLSDSIKLFNVVNLGFAVDTERGLMVPCLKNAGALSLAVLSARLKELAAKAKAGNIEPDLIAPEAATFTVSNLGAYGVEMFTPVLNLPQVGILGVNTIISRPADIGKGIIGFVPFIGLSLTYDHRAIDGGPASLFLKAVKTEIENFPSSYSQV